MDKKDKRYLKLYAVTDRWWVRQRLGANASAVEVREGLLADLRTALEAGVTYVQLREKGEPLTEDELVVEAAQMKQLCAEFDVPFVIDDDVDLASRCGADGVHVGQSDTACAEARRVLGPNKIVGVSAQTVEQALKAEADGADYLGVGAVFPTGSKDDADDVSHETVRAICNAVSVPVIAIGGITTENVYELKGLGLDGVAVISAIFGADDVRAATETLNANTMEALQL